MEFNAKVLFLNLRVLLVYICTYGIFEVDLSDSAV